MSGRNILGSQRAQDVLTCRLCTQYLLEPRELPCGHSFCLRCLERYYAAECQRSETARRRSPSVERRRRGLLPCPAAPFCLHVAVVPADGVAGFPINRKVADMKERVVNEMAQNISKRIGRPQSGRPESDDAASVRSDETDYSDISCRTTSSAPAASPSDHPTGRSPFPNLAKYAKYFEATEKEEGSAKYTPSARSERRRVALSSSFQHRRRRVHTPSPAAFDDTATDGGPRRPSRAESAPHLDSYRPTVRPRQGSSMASPLLRRARPASCILEELADDQDFPNHVGKTTSPTETPRRSTSFNQHRQPLFHEYVILPTHRENISTDEGRRSTPVHDEPVRHGRHNSQDVTTSSKTVPNHDELSRHNRHCFENLETARNSSNTLPTRDESFKDGRHHSEKLETDNKATNAVPKQGESTRQGKHHSYHYENAGTSDKHKEHSSHNSSATATRSEAAKNSKSHSDDLKSGKSSTSGSSRPGRRILPNIPADSNVAEPLSTSAGRRGDVRQQTNTHTSDVHHTRQLPRTDKYISTEYHHATSLGPRQKDSDVSKSSSENASDPNKPKSSTASSSDPSKSRSSSMNLTETERQKTPNTGLSSSHISSRPTNSTSVKSSLSDSVRTKPSDSTKSHNAGHSKTSVSGSKSSIRDSSLPQKSQDSRKFSADPNASQSKSASSSDKVHGSERVKPSHHATPNNRGSVASHHKDKPSAAGSKQKEKQPESSAGGRNSPTANKRPSSKSTPGSGSRLIYKVNAATIQPVLMNSRKTKRSSSDAERRSSADTATEDEAPTDDVEMQEQLSDAAASTHHGSNVSQPSSSRTSANSNASPSNWHGSSGDDKDGDRSHSGTSMPSSPSHQADVRPETRGQSGSNKYHTKDPLPQQPRAVTDDKTPAGSNRSSKDAENDKEKQKQQWQDFMATLRAARAKYCSTDNRTASSESSHPLAVYSDSITPRWRSQRDDFAMPTSIAIMPDGSAVIADIANCLLDFADVEGNVVHSVTGTKPFGVVVGANNMIYVGDRRSRTIRVFDVYGSDVAQWDSETTSFGWICGIAALRNGQLAIVDRERCKVGIYTTGGERVTEFGSYGTKDAQMCMANFVAVDSHDRVIVADSGNHRLKLFDPATAKLVANFAGRGNADGCLLWPKGVTVDGADRIIVADSGNDRICQFADDGRFISNIASSTVKPYHVHCGGDSLLGVTHFALSGASQVDVFALVSTS